MHLQGIMVIKGPVQAKKDGLQCGQGLGLWKLHILGLLHT